MKNNLISAQGLVQQGISVDHHHDEMFITDADVNGIPITVILDSGSSITIVNDLVEKSLILSRHPIIHTKASIVGVNGNESSARVTSLDQLRVGGFLFTNVPVAVANLNVFAELGVASKPTVLLGMNILEKFERIDLDYRKNQVHFFVMPSAMQLAESMRYVEYNRPMMVGAPRAPLAPSAPPPATAGKR